MSDLTSLVASLRTKTEAKNAVFTLALHTIPTRLERPMRAGDFWNIYTTDVARATAVLNLTLRPEH